MPDEMIIGPRMMVAETDGLVVHVDLAGLVVLSGQRFSVVMSPAMADQLAADLTQAARDARQAKGAK